MEQAMKADTPVARERRQHKRYRIKNDTLVFFGMDTGTIVDVGLGGLAVHLVAFEYDIPLPRHLDIFQAQSRFYLPNVPVSLVNEVQTLPNSMFSTLRVKRLCMQFGPLSNKQQSQLNDFISRNTVAES
ncbi:type IV pilus assembly PilZ [Desulfobulbus propionicus DSM 2032]|jgi:hypothetical protein|uniref:Type IV pilus assembly PilZ n=1 Tax=Desulfobulbus propionicus (strain ATCC 33891 / DSM 2032 / VKM B-1956 / 1pr3) TaxID=577650 RepID=A0A7U4DNA8_DESPD|nr:type IV pilus assembly PilZ [Desulfobulbus propionicus]ADW16921.1 type IV pilus assembly PilZ [Desulfobulbus propionicus DSM 2032]